MTMYAGIDLGSNSLKMLIADISSDLGYKRIEFKYYRTRLGEGIRETGIISDAAIERTIRAIKECLEVAQKYNIQDMRFVATEVARRAQNIDKFKTRILQEVGLTLQVISGDEEARLTYLGIASDFLFSEQRLLVFNIGGGSTEISIGRDDQIQFSSSLPLGALTLSNIFLPSTEEIDEFEFQELFGHISKVLDSMPFKDHISQNTTVIGSGGTVTNFAFMDLELSQKDYDVIHLQKISIERIDELLRMLMRLPLAKRKLVKGLEPERADIIVAGGAIIVQILNLVKATKMLVSVKGLSDGIVSDLYLRHRV